MELQMPTSTMTAREFNQHVSRAKRKAKDGPVIITERGRPAYVLLRHEEYEAARSFAVQPKTLLEALASPETEHINIEFPKLDIQFKIPDFD
jgi:prevent-host-death family protein